MVKNFAYSRDISVEEELENIRRRLSSLEARMIGRKNEEFVYPIFARSIKNHHVMRFDKIDCGVAVLGEWFMLGKECDDLSPHTDTTVWQILDYNTERELYDGQPVWAWGGGCVYANLRFYDCKYKCAFNTDDRRNGADYDCYKPVNIETLKANSFIFESFKKLKLEE